MATKKKSAKGTETKAPKKAAPKKAAPKKAAPKKAAPKKAAPKKAAPKKAAPKKAAALHRRDRAGHFDPTYARELRARSGPRDRGDAGHAFFDTARSSDDLAEELGEEFVANATSGEYAGQDIANQVVPEESGGPFTVTPANTEFAYDVDASNPRRSKREPFPTT